MRFRTTHYFTFLLNSTEGASVLIPLNSILDETGNASYWKLVGFAVKLFHLGKTNDGMPPPICLFYMHQKGDGAKNQITSDVVLTALIQRDSGIGSIDNEHLIHVEPVAFALTKSSNGTCRCPFLRDQSIRILYSVVLFSNLLCCRTFYATLFPEPYFFR